MSSSTNARYPLLDLSLADPRINLLPKRLRAWLATCIAASLIGCSPKASPATDELAWAFPQGPSTVYGTPLPAGPFSVPGSPLRFTRAQIDSDTPPDWFPQDHPPAPEIVLRGGPGRPTACAECHLHNGAGFPATADLAGLPAAYIVAQVRAFRDGSRRSAQVGAPNTEEMIKVAKHVSEADLVRGAAYYAGLPHGRWVRVVETTRVPRTVPDHYGWLNRAPGGGTEPVGERIVELSNDMTHAMLGDDHVGITDYAPPGAIARGAWIAQHGPQPCTACHGTDLNGSAMAPRLAGRPAAYLARQIWNFRSGARHDAASGLMAAPASALTPAQIVDVTAFLAAR